MVERLKSLSRFFQVTTVLALVAIYGGGCLAGLVLALFVIPREFAPVSPGLLFSSLDVMFLIACWALSSRRFALAFDLLVDIPNGAIPQPAMAFCRVIAMSRFKLLEEPDQAHWPQISRQRLQSR
jgi:hypothetical protein